MSVVSVDVAAGQPVQVIEVEADGDHVDVVLPPPPAIEVDLPDPQPPLSVDVVAAPPVVLVDATAPPPPLSLDITLPGPLNVDVVAPPPTATQVDVLSAWQAGIPDVPMDGVLYGRLNQSWAGALGLLRPYAPLDSPELVGVPTAPTAAPGTDTTQIATTHFVEDAVTAAHTDDLVTSVAHKIGDVLLYTDDLEDWDQQSLDGGNF